MKKKPAPKKKQFRPVPPDPPAHPQKPPRLSASEALARAAGEMSSHADRRSRGAKHVAEDRQLPIAERRKAAALLGKTEYVTDPEQRPLQWHYDRTDRPYSELWPKFKAFDSLASREAWKHERDTYWTEIQIQVQRRLQRSDVEAMVHETRRLTESFDALLEYVEPIRDADGVIKRHPEKLPDDVTPHPYAGRPVFPLEMPSLDKFIPPLLKLYDKLQGNRSVIVGRPLLSDTASSTTAQHDNIDVPQHVVQEIARSLLRASSTMSDFAIEDLPDNEHVGDEEIDDGFGKPTNVEGDGGSL